MLLVTPESRLPQADWVRRLPPFSRWLALGLYWLQVLTRLPQPTPYTAQVEFRACLPARPGDNGLILHSSLSPKCTKLSHLQAENGSKTSVINLWSLDRWLAEIKLVVFPLRESFNYGKSTLESVPSCQMQIHIIGVMSVVLWGHRHLLGVS